MPIILEYTTRHSAGRFLVSAIGPDTAVAKASSTLRGLQCITATLFCSEGHSLFDSGRVIAIYAVATGWRTLEAAPQ